MGGEPKQVERQRGRRRYPINLGLFIKEYLLEHGRGTQTDIHYAYKEALRETFERAGIRFTKFERSRYHSFVRQFHFLKQLGWVAAVEEEPSALQEYHPEAPPRVYYELTDKGRRAADFEWSSPLRTLYPQFDAKYFREMSRKYAEERRRKRLPPRRPVTAP